MMNVRTMTPEDFDPSPMTVESKLMSAIREVGFYHPLMTLTEAQLYQLHAIGVVRNIEAAMTSYEYIQVVKKTTWTRSLSDIRKNPKVKRYTMWKLAGEGGKKVRTACEYMSERIYNQKMVQKIANILDLHVKEPTEGRVWPPLNANGHAGKKSLVEVDIVMPQPGPLAQAALDVNPSAPVDARPKTAIVEEEVAESKPKSTKHKDLKELIELLNIALVQANVQFLTMEPSASGEPRLEFKQVIVKKVHSLDDLA